MKKLIISKVLKETVSSEIVKEIYRIICKFPSTGIVHHFLISSNEADTILIHTIKSTNFCYTLTIQKLQGAKGDINITVIDVGDKIMMALSSEITNQV